MKQASTQGELKFMVWKELYNHERPFQLFYDIPSDAPDQRKTNIDYEHHTIHVHDARGQESSFDLDQNGFKVVTADVPTSLPSKDEVMSTYLPALIDLVKKEVEDVDRIEFFNWRLRSSEDIKGRTHVNMEDGFQTFMPARIAHLDQSGMAAVNRLRLTYPDELPELISRRIRIINIWKPLDHPVCDWPLAVADGSTVDAQRLIDTDMVRQHYVGANRFLLHQPQLKWWYVREQKPNEVLLFKQFDSKPDVAASCCPHAAFNDPTAAPNMPGRKSIEVRALVVGKAASEGNRF